jgi:hypothetical protein
MRLLAALLLALAAAACGDSPCQELGERICRCQPGLGEDACRTQVEEQLKNVDPGDDFCDAHLATCNHPTGGELCEFLLTEDGKIACGLAPEPAP